MVPVAKVRCPKTLSDFWPVALTPLVMKTFEHIVKLEIFYTFKPLEGDTWNEMIIIQLFFILQLLIVFSHIILLINFYLILIWILTQYLGSQFLFFNRSQRVRVYKTLSSKLSSSTGSPQGCVFSPLLFVLYTNEYQSNHEPRFIPYYAEDSVILSL